MLNVIFFLNIVPFRVKRAPFFFDFHPILLLLYLRKFNSLTGKNRSAQVPPVLHFALLT